MVATLGTALTEQHVKTLTRFSKQIIYLFDGDAAGRRQLNAPSSSSSRARSTFGAWCCQTIWIPWNSLRHAGETRCARSSMMLSRSWISFSGNLPSAAMFPLPPGAPSARRGVSPYLSLAGELSHRFVLYADRRPAALGCGYGALSCSGVFRAVRVRGVDRSSREQARESAGAASVWDRTTASSAGGARGSSGASGALPTVRDGGEDVDVPYDYVPLDAYEGVAPAEPEMRAAIPHPASRVASMLRLPRLPRWCSRILSGVRWQVSASCSPCSRARPMPSGRLPTALPRSIGSIHA